jgi:hypothetical protein
MRRHRAEVDDSDVPDRRECLAFLVDCDFLRFGRHKTSRRRFDDELAYFPLGGGPPEPVRRA